jgi:hypothetical protein
VVLGSIHLRFVYNFIDYFMYSNCGPISCFCPDLGVNILVPFPMLPRPASSFKRQNANNTTSRINKRLLFARSRLTNLAVVIIGFSFTCSLLLNLSYWLSTPSSSGSERRAPNSILATISRDIYAVPPTHLVIVAGHAIWNGCLPERKADVGEWILGPEVERGSASIHAFFQHITNGWAALHFP